MITTRPSSHDERDQAIQAVDGYAKKPGVDPAGQSLIELIYRAPCAGYLQARQGYAAAIATWLQAAETADDADEAFDTTFRRWVRTVTRADGTSAAPELATLLGGVVPSDLIKRPYRDELTRTQGLLDRLPASLGGDVDKLAQLRQTLTTFEPVVTAWELACREKLNLGSRLGTATAEFDAAYGKLVRSLKAVLGDEAALAILPRFVRSAPRGEADAPADGGQAPTA